MHQAGNEAGHREHHTAAPQFGYRPHDWDSVGFVPDLSVCSHSSTSITSWIFCSISFCQMGAVCSTQPCKAAVAPLHFSQGTASLKRSLNLCWMVKPKWVLAWIRIRSAHAYSSS